MKMHWIHFATVVLGLLLGGSLAGCESSPGDTRQYQIDKSDPGGQSTDM